MSSWRSTCPSWLPTGRNSCSSAITTTTVSARSRLPFCSAWPRRSCLSLAVLQLAQLFPAVQLARRIQAYEAGRSRLLRRAIEASELERQRIARDLHDEVIQELSGLSYVMESEELHSPVGQRALFSDARRILQDNVRSLRAMTSELYPPDLNRLGLSGALARLGDPLEERGISLELDLPEQCELDRDRAALFYRVAREALANTAKHSRATKAELHLHQDGHRSEIRIQDDGCGFDQSQGSPEGHFGLRIMKDTIGEAGGTLQLMSAPGRGTTVIARFGVGGTKFRPPPSTNRHRFPRYDFLIAGGRAGTVNPCLSRTRPSRNCWPAPTW